MTVAQATARITGQDQMASHLRIFDVEDLMQTRCILTKHKACGRGLLALTAQDVSEE